ncbi:SLOG family protein [Phyllobacterium myrsinacearum]|uniref:Putative phage-like protein YoqJ n=1 Tax=Phyllobacterium myrsinacearum TaxID=28101 RepID=A0A839EUC9_9HYPH|nr:SLOG family protein [Phyllobacterium myrsinacearum]MBA8881788.1 putative phage-like protein YoqJ [Phyllobacterium myrsinacearum]
MPAITLTATGHRHVQLPNWPRMRMIEGRTEQALKSIVQNTLNSCLDLESFVSCGMLGFDMCATEVAIEIGLPTTLAIPFAAFGSKWPDDMRKRLDRMLERAKEVITVSKGPFSLGKMRRANHWRIDRANMVAALWDGRPSDTSDTIIYAYSRRVPVQNLYRDFVKHADQFLI